LTFWDLAHDASTLAVIDEAGQPLTYGELEAQVARACGELRAMGQRQLGFLFASNTLRSLVTYLACLRTGHVPLLLPPALAPALREQLLTVYQPRWVFDAGVLTRQPHETPALHPDLALLLSTSGSTGSPKLVRLSHRALQSNAAAIARFLELGPGECAITTLPPHYSYGLSVINSHLQAGARIVLTERSVLERPFWEQVSAADVTSLAGVPSFYQLLHRTGFDRRALPALRTLTQAGGKLEERLTRWLLDLARQRGWRVFVMYGQTEATARISYVPPEHLAQKIGAIGIAIPGGALSLDSETREMIYEGPNVMMGYAEQRADLARGDELSGVLRTGELGRVDDDGFFYLTARLKRFVKLAGHRVDLDAVEQMLQHELQMPVAAGGRDDALAVCVEARDEALAARAAALLHERYRLHASLYRVVVAHALPLLASGKKDYAAVMALLDAPT
jgi:long-chain acyl-CoA synthetase